MTASRRAGFTLIEALIALALGAILVAKIVMVVDSAEDASVDGTAELVLEDQARRVLDQIAFAVMSADRDELFPDPESPEFSREVTFRASLGVQGGVEILADPERIGLGADGRQVVWRQNPDMPEERRVAWCNVVRPFFSGETENAIDDNGNGLADETGLSFTLEGRSVTIRLCLERKRSGGRRPIVRTVETVVTARN